MIKGTDYSIRIVSEGFNADIPFLSKTLREKFCLVKQEAAIEGKGRIRAVTESIGSTGGFTTPLTIGTVPALFSAIFGSPVSTEYVSGTRSLYRRKMELTDISPRFDIYEQLRVSVKKYPLCFCKGFELRITRDAAVKLHLNIGSDSGTAPFPQNPQNPQNAEQTELQERFKEYGITYNIDGAKQDNIYHLVITCDKQNGCRTEVRIHRYIKNDSDYPTVIENFTIKARLFRDCYENKRFGAFEITLKNLRLISDETEVTTTDTVIGALRYYVCGEIDVYAYNSNEE
jgi:hypothetical protein